MLESGFTGSEISDMATISPMINKIKTFSE